MGLWCEGSLGVCRVCSLYNTEHVVHHGNRTRRQKVQHGHSICAVACRVSCACAPVRPEGDSTSNFGRGSGLPSIRVPSNLAGGRTPAVGPSNSGPMQDSLTICTPATATRWLAGVPLCEPYSLAGRLGRSSRVLTDRRGITYIHIHT